MPKEVRLTQWGMAMNEGTITEWLVKPGDRVVVGQPLVDVESAKAAHSVDAMDAGTIGEILVEAGETVPVNTTLATILGADEAPPENSSAGPATAEAPPPATTHPAARAGAAATAGGTSVQVVPLARKLAREHGIDLAALPGSGPHGRVMVADVEAAIARQDSDAGPAPSAETDASDQRTMLTRMRRVIAERMTQSLQTTAQLTLVSTADVTQFAALRAAWEGEDRPSFTDAVIRACALALRQHPRVNARIEGDDVVECARVDIGMAVALEDGLVVPVVRDADQRGLAELSRVTADLAARARSRQLPMDDYADSTFSVTSLGGQGIDAFTPILNPPEAAILGIGRARETLVREGDGMAWRQQMTLSLTIDHRLIDGYPGALFLAEVVANLEDPDRF